MIRVVFLFFVLECFHGFENLYKFMKNDQNFDPILVLTPNTDVTNYKGYSKDRIIGVLTKKNLDFFLYEQIKLEDLDPAFIFFNTPYNRQYPKELTQKATKYKLCYFPYGHSIWDPFIVNGFGDIDKFSFIFHENELNKDVFLSVCKKNSLVSKTFVTGTPKIEHLDTIDKRERIKTIMWCPRWTKNSTCNQHMTTLVQFCANREVKMKIRLHPLDQTNRNKCIDLAKSHENITIDTNYEYTDTFNTSDMLISDLSTIIAEYFCTGKPVIYTWAKGDGLNPFGKAISAGIYTVKNSQSLKSALDTLVSEDQDQLWDKRSQLIEQYYSTRKESSKNICEILKQSV